MTTFVPQNEQGVIVLFAMLAKDAGWGFVEIRTAFPDAILQKDGEVWQVEFEFVASNFLDHKHDHRACDMIVCWKNDYGDCSLPIIALDDPGSLFETYTKCDPRDKEIEYWKRRALAAERRASDFLRDDMETTSRATRRQDALINILRDLDGLPVDVINRSSLGEQLGVTRQTIGSDLDALAAAGRLVLNGHVEVRER